MPAGFTGWARDNWGDIDLLKEVEGVEASDWDDVLIGSDGANRLDGAQGNDTIDGAGGEDWVEYNGAEAGVVVSLAAREASDDGAGYREGMTDRAVANIIKDRAKAAGLDPALFSGHSLRSGFLTSAAGAGASTFKMMEVSRHKQIQTLAGYVRQADQFKQHAGAAFM